MNDTIEVNGELYRKVETKGESLRVVLCDNRGLTLVGHCDLSGNSETVLIRSARCVIQWGTTRHLGELVNGPLPNTKLGAQADVHVFRRQLVLFYDVKGRWHE